MSEFDSIPDELKERDQCYLWGTDTDPPKKPLNGQGYNANWTDPGTGMSFEEALNKLESVSKADGIGFSLLENDPYIALDLDGILKEPRKGRPKSWVPDLDFIADTWAEYSQSGTGIHVFTKGESLPDWWHNLEYSEEDHEGIDAFEESFIACTGDVVDFANDSITELNIDSFLFEAYNNIEGESPRVEPKDGQERYDGDSDLTEEQVREALEHVDPDLHYDDWLRVGMAVYDWDSGSRGKSVFEEWSKSNPKWEEKHGQPHINDIWDNDSPDGKISVGTLVYHAKEGGWSPPGRKTDGGTAIAKANTDTGPELDSSVSLDPMSVISMAGYDPDPEEGPGLSEIENSEIAYAVVELLTKSDGWHFRWVSDTDELYAYKDGIWRQGGDQVLRAACRKALRNQHTKHLYNEITHQLLSHPVLRVDRDHLGSPEGTIAVANGLLDLRNRTLRDLSPEDMAIRQLPTEYDPDASYEDSMWMEFLEDSVRDGDLDKLQEYAGYVLWHNSQPFGKALFLLGPTDSGKGTFLRVIESVIGEENVANQSLFDLMQSRFGPAELFGNVANIRNEVTPGGIKNVERFKEMTGGGDRISAEKKGQDPFQFKVTQKFLFATNQVPDIQHAGEPFYNRLLFVGYPETVPPEEQDPRLDEKLLEERTAILNWMLDGLDRLFEQNGFSSERNHEAKRDLTDKYGNLVRRFKHNMLEVTGEGEDVVHKKDLHGLFKDYAEYVGKKDVPQQGQFTKKLKNVQGITDGQSRRVDGEDGDRIDVFKNVRVNEEHVKTIGADMPRHATAGDGETSQKRF